MADTLRLNGLAVRVIRERSGIQQQHLAESCGISASYLANIERGIKSPRSDVAFRVAEQLAVPLAAITYPAPRASTHRVTKTPPTTTKKSAA